jgi:hypothetical protein
VTSGFLPVTSGFLDVTATFLDVTATFLDVTSSFLGWQGRFVAWVSSGFEGSLSEFARALVRLWAHPPLDRGVHVEFPRLHVGLPGMTSPRGTAATRSTRR